VRVFSTLVILCGHVAAAPEPALPLPSDAMRSWRIVHEWVQAWRAPEEPASIDPPGATGVCVTIRLDHLVLGRATDVGEDDAALYRAARAAIGQARERAPVERSAGLEDRLRLLAPSLTLDIQFAGALVPLLGDTFDEAALSVAAGLDGAAVRIGDRVRAVFPATMLSQNATAASALAATAAEMLNEPVNIPGRDLKSLREHRALTPYRFPALHLAQIAPGREPVFLTRGGRVIPPTDISGPALRAFADHLADNLRSRIDEQGVMPGPYEPWNDGYAHAVGTPTERALAAFALARYSTAPTTDAARSLAATRAAWVVLDALAREPSWADDPASAAGFLIALHSLPPRPTDLDPARAPSPELEQHALGAIALAFGESGWTPSLAPAPRALVAYAAAVVSETRPGACSPDTALSMLRALLGETPPGQIVALMPWAVWAELELATPEQPIPSAVALVEMRSLVWRHQVSLTDTATISPDLLGGIVFTAGPSPLPTWQTARPLPALASMLGDTRLTPVNDRPGEFARLLLSLRFLRQLAADEHVVHLYPNPTHALWGVREGLWNQRQPADATAMTLLAVSETLRATRSAAAPRQKP